VRHFYHLGCRSVLLDRLVYVSHLGELYVVYLPIALITYTIRLWFTGGVGAACFVLRLPIYPRLFFKVPVFLAGYWRFFSKLTFSAGATCQ
jgi:hypothetical protein